MSANLVRNQARSRQPRQGTGVRHGHRIAKGLVFATTGAAGFYDFVSGTFPNGKSGATVGVMPRGRTASPAAASGQITWQAGSTGLDRLTGVGTLLICMRSNNNAGNWRSFGSREDNTTGDGVYLLYDDNANVTNGFNAGGNNNNYRANSNSNALGTNSEQSFHTFGFSWDGAGVQTYADGKPDKLTTGGFAAFTPNANTGRVTRLQSGGSQSDFLFAYAWNRVLTDAEIADITANPWQIFTAANQPLYTDVISSSGTTGTLAATESSDTAAFSGLLTFAGSIAAAEAQDSAAFSGSSSVPGASGSLSVTEAADTASLSGLLTFSGSLAATESQDTAAFSGLSFAPGVSGTLAAPDVADSASMSGSVAAPSAIGSLSATEAKDVASLSGSVSASVSGSLAATEQQDSAQFYSAVAGIPSSRVLVVPPESRVYAVPAECRVLIIQEAA